MSPATTPTYSGPQIPRPTELKTAPTPLSFAACAARRMRCVVFSNLRPRSDAAKVAAAKRAHTPPSRIPPIPSHKTKLVSGGRPWTTTSVDVYWQIAQVVVIATLIPFALTLAAVRLIPAARVGLTATFEPVVAALAAWIVLGERLDPPQVLGGVVVLGAIVIAQSLRPTAGSV